MSVGLVIAGGGARGAYEAGVLAEILPWLEARGERPTVLAGTSVGALSAALLASVAHLPAAEAGERLVARWAQVTEARVIEPIALRQSPRTALRYLAEVTGVPGVRLEALLDPTPLGRTVAAWLDWDAVHANVEDGTVDALAVVATSADTERAVVFVEGREKAQLPDAALVDYEACELTAEHVLASAAIPVAFPAMRIETPPHAAGWYFDGGTRLNTPVKPALDLGVERVVVVATHAPFRSARRQASAPRPDFSDGALELIQATLVDPLIQDLRTLGKVNDLAARLGDRAAPYRVVPYVFAGPSEQGRIGRIVAEVFEEHFSGIGGALRARDVALLTRLLGGAGAAHAELISYLLFRPEFVAAAIDAGREDGRAAIAAAGDDPWRIGPISASSVG